jgi:hypothetical protein
VLLEVDALDGRVRRKPRTVQDDELEFVRERPLRDPRRVPVPDAAVHEDEAAQ